jgi:hypothetical protein
MKYLRRECKNSILLIQYIRSLFLASKIFFRFFNSHVGFVMNLIETKFIPTWNLWPCVLIIITDSFIFWIEKVFREKILCSKKMKLSAIFSICYAFADDEGSKPEGFWNNLIFFVRSTAFVANQFMRWELSKKCSHKEAKIKWLGAT